MKVALFFCLCLLGFLFFIIGLKALTGMDVIVHDTDGYPFHFKTYYSLYKETSHRLRERELSADGEICIDGNLVYCKGSEGMCKKEFMPMTGFHTLWPKMEIYGSKYFGRVTYDGNGDHAYLKQIREVKRKCP